MKIKKLFIFLLFILFLNSCTGLQDTLEGKKRSDNSDEFLIEKKNPLTVPPDISELPVPLDQEENQENNDSELIDIKETLKIGDNQTSTSENSSGKKSNLQEEILEKINN
tara:strand:- start:206 stop:535 length:330 start_codon:yes stop_codon:yes gene_type:complete